MKKFYTDPASGVAITAAEAMTMHRNGESVIVNHSPNRITIIKGAARKERNADDENRRHCKHIAEELEAYADGNVYRCPECGKIHRLPDDVGDKYRCPDCEAVSAVNDWEQCGILDFFGDIYDMEYHVSSNKEYRSCRIMVACGGPNIYIDTAAASVKLYWWSDYAEYPISYAARDAVDEWAKEYWDI